MGFVRLVRRLSLALAVVAALLVGAAVLVVCQMVIWRYALAASTVWQTEFVTFAILAATFLGSPYVLQLGGHVNVDLLPQWCGRRGRLILGWLADLLGLAFAATVVVLGLGYWWKAWVGGWTTPTVWALPLWIPISALVVGMGMLVLEYVARLVEAAQGGRVPLESSGGEE